MSAPASASNFPLAEYLPVSGVASLLGCSERTLRNHAKRTDHPLPSVQRRGKLHVHPREAAEYLRVHAPKALRRAPQSEAPQPAAPAEIPPPSDDLVTELRALLDHIRHLAAEGSTEAVKASVAIVDKIHRIEAARARTATLFTPDDVVEMLQAIGKLWVASTQDHLAPVAAKAIVQRCRQLFDVDLAAHNVDAARLLEQVILEIGQLTIAAVQKHVDDQVAGQKLLLEAEAS